MAVIESKGDGFSLFNGVKLPSLPEYDETEYPYALIMSCDEFDELSLYLMAEPLECVINEDGVNLYHNDIGTTLRYNIVDNSWHFVERYRDSLDVYQCEAYWTNTDIIDVESRSVYLSASEPIPLDGMNVIEWDGDTEGLENMSGLGNFWLVSEIADVDTNREAVFVRYRSSLDDLTVYNTVPSVVDGYFKYKTMVYYVATASETYTTTGLHFCNNGSLWCQLFAYYPIEEETKPISYIEYLANPKYRKYPFRGFFGWLWAKKHSGGGSEDQTDATLVDGTLYIKSATATLNGKTLEVR